MGSAPHQLLHETPIWKAWPALTRVVVAAVWPVTSTTPLASRRVRVASPWSSEAVMLATALARTIVPRDPMAPPHASLLQAKSHPRQAAIVAQARGGVRPGAARA